MLLVIDEALRDMIDYDCIIQQITDQLKWYWVCVVNKLAKYLDDDSIQNRITQNFYDVPLRELVHWGLL